MVRRKRYADISTPRHTYQTTAGTHTFYHNFYHNFKLLAFFNKNSKMARRSWKRVGFNFEEEGFDFRIHDSKSSFDLCC